MNVSSVLRGKTPAPEPTRPVTEVEANSLAFGLLTMRNSARTALTAATCRGQLAAWRKSLPNLPGNYTDAVDVLDVFSRQMIAQLHADQASIAPHIARLNAEQPSKDCWSRPVPEPAKRGVWTGRARWAHYSDDYIAPLMGTSSCAISDKNRRAILTAIATLVNAAGRNLTASHDTIAQLARSEFGCTLAISTATQRVRTIRRLLEAGRFLITHARGGHLTSLERLAAEAHHGGRQTRCASTCDLNLPEHLRPTPPPAPNRPNYAQDLKERLDERDRTQTRKSTYAVGSGPTSLTGTTWVARPRARAREHFLSPTPNEPQLTPSLRDWRITNELSRKGRHTAAENGPYAHLVGPMASQMSSGQFARVIAAYVPPHVDTETLLRGLAHIARSQMTGYIALGLKTRPRNAMAWLSTVLRRIDWKQHDSFPSWSTTARAFGIHWCGDRHMWRNKPEFCREPAATDETRKKRMGEIRGVLDKTRRTRSH